MTAPAPASTPASTHSHPPDPEAIPYSPAAFLILRACELWGAIIFMAEVPRWKPLTWWLLVASAATWRMWYSRTPSFKNRSWLERRQIYRWSIWVMMFWVGSASYFLYVPGNLTLHMVLGVYLLASATLVALRVAGDFVRTLVAVCLIIVPTAVRLMIEGAGGNLLTFMLGVGGFLITATIIFMSRLQERALLEQFELRQRAERALDAVASVGLAKARFFAAVSHDLRQPVHAIGLYLDPLTRVAKATQNQAAQDAAEGIRQSWRALDDLLSQVLDLTRLDSGALEAQLQAVEVAPLVRDLMMQHSAAAERAGIRLVALTPPGRFVQADALMLKRVLSNLLDNAIKFSAPGSMVVVTLRQAGQSWRLQVRDAGIGIDKSLHDRIFEEFVQIGNDARDRQRGLGLGLAISRRFVRLMGGSIALRSAPDCGSCITVTLQKVEAAAAGQAGEPIAHPALAGDQWRSPGSLIPDDGDSSLSVDAPGLAPQAILLVEDDLLVGHAMRQLLESWGMTVRHVETAAAAALEAAFGDIAICDVRLPGGESGVDVALQLRAKGKKVLLLTGETDAALRQAAQTHAMRLLIKPVSAARLGAALREL
jgi:two-component system, sensor histidine kinase